MMDFCLMCDGFLFYSLDVFKGKRKKNRISYLSIKFFFEGNGGMLNGDVRLFGNSLWMCGSTILDNLYVYT